MKVQNLKMMTCPFEEYLKLPGWSYSGIKGAVIVPTRVMQLGTRVHNYLLSPEEYDYEDIRLVKPLATEVKANLGSLLPHLTSELAVTADFLHEGICMKYKGRIDLSIHRLIVVDLKVSEVPLLKSIEFFGYDKQLSGYAMAIGARMALIIRINPKTLNVTRHVIPIQSGWWEQQIKMKGEAV